MSKELKALDIQANFINAIKELLSKTDHNVIQINITRNMAQEIVNIYEQHKNLKPSEALKCLERTREFLLHRTNEMSFQDLRTIEQALTTKSKKELAFDIIKAKKVYIRDILECENAHEYNLECAYEEDWLDDEQFKLLKEMCS